MAWDIKGSYIETCSCDSKVTRSRINAFGIELEGKSGGVRALLGRLSG